MCLACDAESVWNGTQCVASCPQRHYNESGICTGKFLLRSYNYFHSACLSLNPDCISCTNSSICLECNNSKLRYGDKCVDKCGAGTYEENGSCEGTCK